MFIALAIFVFTLLLVIWQPRHLGIGWSAALGATLALLTGVVNVTDVVAVWHIVWNATLAFVAIIIISILLDEAGLFEWTALHVGRWGAGQGHKLFLLIILLGACVSALFANDGAALIMTPIVMSMLLALGFDQRATLAYVMAAGFIADTASLPLVISNLVNIVSSDFFDIGFRHYAAVMVPVNLVSVLASLAVLWLMFRRSLPACYEVSLLKRPALAIRDPKTFRAGWVVLALLLIGFFVLEPLGVPVSAIAMTGAAALLLIAAHGKVVNPVKALRSAPWQIVVFSLGMYLVVYGLRNEGLVQYVAGWLNVLAQHGLWAATLGTGVLSALLSSIMNNLPGVLVGVLAIDASHAQGVIREAMAFANVIGSDLGPKITPIGSLATLLWLHVMQGKGLRIGWGYYFRVGAVLTLPVLIITLSALAIRLG